MPRLQRPDDHDPGRPGAQPQERRPRAAARPADRVHRAVGLGEVVARVRHDLRRGSAPLRRVAVGVRPPVPRPDGQARRRLHRGPVAGDLDRPEVGVAQPAVDRRHDHRDLRLPAAALRAHRRAALPELRARCITRQTPQQIVDRVLELPEGTRFQVLAPVVRGRKGEYEGLLEGARAAGLHPGPDRRRASHEPRPTSVRALRRATSSTRSRSSSTGWCGATASSGGSPTRSRPRCASPKASPRSRSSRATATATATRDAHVLGAPGVHPLRAVVRGARAAQLLVQLAVRRVRAVRRARHRFEVDPELVVPDDDLQPRRRRDRAVVGLPQPVLRPRARGGRRRVRLHDRHAVEEARARRTSRRSCTAPATATVHVQYSNRYGRQRSYHTRVRGRGPVARAPARRGRERPQRGSRSRATCARCRAPRATARASSPTSLAVTVGDTTSTSSATCRSRKAAEFLGGARALRTRPDDRRARC